MCTFPSSAPQPPHWRLLCVGDNKASVKGSQSRAEEREALCPVAGPTGALVSSPIFKAEFKTLVFECIVLETVFLVTEPQIEGRVSLLARSLQRPTCANAFCSH